MAGIQHIEGVGCFHDFFIGWQEIFRPAMTDTGGKAIFIGTPKKENPNLKMAVISVFESEDDELKIPEKEYIPTDFNLIVPADMTKTY